MSSVGLFCGDVDRKDDEIPGGADWRSRRCVMWKKGYEGGL